MDPTRSEVPGAPSRPWAVIDNQKELRIKLAPPFFISSHPEALDAMAVAARRGPIDPDYASAILNSIYHELGPSDAFMKDFDKFGEAAIRMLPGQLLRYFREEKTPLLDQPGLSLKALQFRKEEIGRVTERFRDIITRVDPFFAMARAAVEPVKAYGDEIVSDISEKKEPDFPPERLTGGQKLDRYLQEKILDTTRSQSYRLVDSVKNIKGALAQPTASFFTRPSLELSISKEQMQQTGSTFIRQETRADSEVLADVLYVYRTALAYIATGGSNSFPVLDHWRELSRGKKTEGGYELVKTGGFAEAFKGVLAHHQADAEKASLLIRQALSPVLARIIEERAQFPGETFPLHPQRIIWFDRNKRTSVDLVTAVREELERQRRATPSGELGQAQHQAKIKQGEVLLDVLEDCRRLFGEVTPEQMEAMYPLLTAGPAGLEAERNITALALSQAASGTDGILGNIDRAFNTTIDFPLPEGADEALKELAQTLGKEIGFEYLSLGEERKMKVSGKEMYRLLQDKGVPDGLKRKVASFCLRKFVGYPPDLAKTPDILGPISETRRREIIDFRNRLQQDPFVDITSDEAFDPKEAKKIVKLRLRTVHPDVNTESELKRQATFLYNEVMNYMDDLEREKREGIWATLTDI